MKSNFNINSIETSKQMNQSFFKRRHCTFERKRRERRENYKNARNNARDEITENDIIENDVIESNAKDETNVLMKIVFKNTFQFIYKD